MILCESHSAHGGIQTSNFGMSGNLPDLVSFPLDSGFVRGLVLLELVNSFWKIVSQLIWIKMPFPIFLITISSVRGLAGLLKNIWKKKNLES